jgi:hypothetical protein
MSRLAIPVVGLALVIAGGGCREPARPSAQPLPQEVYVWQRTWTTGVVHAVRQASPRVSGFTVLAAEVAWTPQAPRVAIVSLDGPALRWTGRPVALALRIGPYRGDFAAQTAFLARLAAGLIAEARATGLEPSELQVDFDAAESQLTDYRLWLAAIRVAVRPTPLTMTVLPAWLDRAAFVPVVSETDGYVLQVHSVIPPRVGQGDFTLCDPAAARRWVDRAGRIGRPFRVALPSYAYMAAFSRDGRLLGLEAEGPAVAWGSDATIRRVEASAEDMARLAREWAVRRPAALRGLVWYRLPVAGDNLNWRWPTLSAILSGETPRRSIRVQTDSPSAGLVDLTLVNEGELDATADLAVVVRWTGAAPLASDAVAGFQVERGDAGGCLLRRGRGGDSRVPRPGDRQVVAWFRFAEPTGGVTGEVEEGARGQ